MNKWVKSIYCVRILPFYDLTYKPKSDWICKLELIFVCYPWVTILYIRKFVLFASISNSETSSTYQMLQGAGKNMGVWIKRNLEVTDSPWTSHHFVYVTPCEVHVKSRNLWHKPTNLYWVISTYENSRIDFSGTSWLSKGLQGWTLGFYK